MTADVRLLERLIRHQIFIQRFSGSQIKAALPILRALAKDLRKRIQAGDATEFQMGRMAALEADIRLIVTNAVTDIQGELDLEDFAKQEVEFTQQLLGAAVSIDLAQGANVDMIAASVTRKQMTLVSGDTIKKLTIREAFDEFAGAVALDAMRVVQTGVIEGRTQADMARGVAELVSTRSRRQAATIVRTSVNHIGGSARAEVYQQNADILEGERFLAVLDSRTTITCSSIEARDEIYPLGRGPIPPMHFGCRSIRLPVVKEEYRIAPLGERASYEGPVSNQLRYGGFLKRQSREFVEDVLGKKRADLFLSGKLKMEQFTDDAGRVLDLDELRARYDLTMG